MDVISYVRTPYRSNGNTSGIQTKHEKKLRLILTNLEQAATPDDMDLPGLFMHQLKGDRKDIWSVRVSGNWRVTYRFVGDDYGVMMALFGKPSTIGRALSRLAEKVSINKESAL